MVCASEKGHGMNARRLFLPHLRAALVAFAGILILALPEATEAAFARRFVITVGAGQVTGGPHPNFPMLVSFQHLNLRSTANGGLVTSDAGDDILLRGEDGTTCAGASPCVLDHEIESYDPVSGTIVLWVRVPSVNDGTVIYLYYADAYYADAAVTCSQENTAGVWDSSHREVFHLHETGEHTDSTQNAFTAVTRGTVTQAAAGKIGPTDDFQGGANGLTPAYANISDSDITTTDSFTFESWAYFRSYVPGGYVGIAMKGREAHNFDGSPAVGFGDCTAAPCGDWVGLYKANADSFSFGWTWGGGCKQGNLDDGRLPAAAQVQLNQWYHVAATYDQATTTRTLYVDGQQVATDTVGACVEADIPHYTMLGNDNHVQDYMDGLIDEVRISSSARSGNWIQTSYNNQNAPATFHPSVVDQVAGGVSGTCSGSANPCEGGPGSCNLRSIGTSADYSLNTVSATNGSDVVTGASTAWQSANRGRGDDIDIAGVPYTVLAVDSETSLRLTTPYAGGTGALKAYTISRKFTNLVSPTLRPRRGSPS